MTVFLDSNLILDFLMQNRDFADEAFSVLKLAVTKQVDYYVSAASLTDIFYILNKNLRDSNRAKNMLRSILKFVSVAGVDEMCIVNALNSDWPDFEDSVQHEVASQIHADYIVTRNVRDYKNSAVVTVTPAEFLSRI